MRNSLLLMCILALSTAIQAQKVSFCEALPLLEVSATNDFSDIRKNEDASVTYPTTYFSGLQVQEAISSSVIKSRNGYSFKVDFGSFASKDDARKKMNTIISGLKDCYSGINTAMSTDMLSVSEFHTLYLTTEIGFRLYDAKFKLRTLSGKSDLSFEFNSNEEKSFLNQYPAKAYYDYIFIKSSVANDGFSVALRKLLIEAQTGFKSITGTEADYGRGFTCYRTTFQLPGYSSFIEDRTLDNVLYVVPTFQIATPENFTQTVDKAKQIIESALGSDYAFRSSDDAKKLIYVHKNQPDKPVVEILLKENDNDFILELYVMNLE